jgi:hypothetical protein
MYARLVGFSLLLGRLLMRWPPRLPPFLGFMVVVIGFQVALIGFLIVLLAHRLLR